MTNTKRQGFNEDIDPLLGKAKKHSIIAQKTKFDKEQVSDTSAIAPIEEEDKTLKFKDTEELSEFLEQFEDETGVELQVETEDDMLIVTVPKEKAEELIEFLAENDINVKQEIEEAVDEKTINVCDTDNKDVAVDSSAELKSKVDRIIIDVQKKRSKRAVTSDKLRTAKKVGDKGNAGDLISWLKNPGKTDLQGVDTPEAE
jgi:NADH/NAD ratio-sensing transcriptional regulator Rex